MLKFETVLANAYKSAYDFPLKKKFSDPKIYTANGDLNKRWYIYFSYRDPKTNRLKRQTPIYSNANSYSTKEERLAVLVPYRQALLKLLKMGYSPYQDNTQLYLDHLNSKESGFIKQPLTQPSVEPKQENIKVEKVDKGITITKAIDFSLSHKEKTLRASSYRTYKNHLENFLKWLKKKEQSSFKFTSQLNKKVLNDFLNHVLLESSARNRNNYRSSLSSLFQFLEDNDMVKENEVKKIKKLKTNPKRNKTYNQQQHEEIFKYLEQVDPVLLLFIKFVSYNFLRPIEVCRLQVGDIDIKNQKITFKAKNSALKTKIIPDILINELPDLTQFEKDALLFTPQGYGKNWDSKLENRRNYFTKRFKKVVKEKFELDENHTMYSFRHTFITKVYRNLNKKYPSHLAKSKLILMTGHSSMSGLENYLREIDAELPKDYSDLLKD